MKPKRKNRQSKAGSGHGETRLSEGEMTAMIAARAHERTRQRGFESGWQAADWRVASAEILWAEQAPVLQNSGPPTGNGENLSAESPVFLEVDAARTDRKRKPDGEVSVEDPLQDWPEDG